MANTRPIANDISVSGMVTVSPGISNFVKEPMMIPNSLSSMMPDPHIRPAFVGSARIMQIR